MIKTTLVTALILLLSTVNSYAARDILVFFDASGSTSKTTSDRYFSEFRSAIVGKLAEGDTLTSALINENTRGTFNPFGTIQIRKKGTLESPTGYGEELEEQKIRGLGAVKKRLRESKPAIATDILSVLGQAKTYFASSGRAGQKVLVIFSDMVEETSALNLSKLKNESQIGPLFNKISKNIPQMPGVDVYAVGAVGNGPHGFVALETFWKKVFSVSGARCKLFDHSISSF
jgi:hypothetical protein